jgi:hypothetical protein
MDDFYIGPNPTAMRIVSGHSLSPDNGTAATSPSLRQFGNIIVLNDLLTEGPDRGNTRVGKAHGFVVRSSEGGVMSELHLHLFLEAGEYNGRQGQPWREAGKAAAVGPQNLGAPLQIFFATTGIVSSLG